MDVDDDVPPLSAESPVPFDFFFVSTTVSSSSSEQESGGGLAVFLLLFFLLFFLDPAVDEEWDLAEASV